ncbi:Acyl-CoA--sterol O-acyltransferase 1 [Heracleum sosnowskyi]|uniref:Acyl-CoA--sterol O-acyltransferase 1 n=1 Tax=Heracleum sosnowskyi TaxID=360622 RepID=A0AAD8GND3_9APIA|nr:Acyl-CoA--sterol O-acyltransferase 1 [Heracleum sosnowskyi]
MEDGVLQVFKKGMEGEINNSIMVWTSVYISLSCCFFASKIIPIGFLRLLAFLPVIFLFLVLPLYLHTIHLGGMTAFFIAWLCNFKLLMFCFGIGPLSYPSISLLHFLAIGSLPIKIQQQDPSSKTSKHVPIASINYAIKTLLLVLFVRAYDYVDHIHPKVVYFMYAFHMYFVLELALVGLAALARALLGLELEPQFNEPYLSTSLQDFWGRRWNLMVTRILRPTVYEPAHKISTMILGRQLASLPAILATFIVSAIMHELMFYYLGRVRPRWVVTLFFLLHGFCLVAEIAIKKALGDRLRLPRFVSRTLTVVFVLATGLGMFLPELLKCNTDIRAFQEYAAVGKFVKDLGHALMAKQITETKP